MVSDSEREHIRALLATARAALAVLKKDVADAERAGLADVAREGRTQQNALESKLTRMESVYGPGA